MFSDPQSITVNSVAKSLPRIEINSNSATYQMADGTFGLRISHQRSKGRIRSMARVDQTAVVTDPISNTNDSEDLGIFVVIDRPEFGFSMAQVEQLTAALTAWLTTGNVDKLYGTEF